MRTQEILTLLNNKIATLINQRHIATAAGDIGFLQTLESEIAETEVTIGQISTLV